MSGLPHGWAQATIADTGAYINGLAFKPSDWVDDGIPIIRIQNLNDAKRPFNRTTRAVGDEYVVRKGDVLVSWSATLDVFEWRGADSVLNQHIFRVVPNAAIASARFQFFLLKHAMNSMRHSAGVHGSTMHHINRGPFLAFPVQLPPLAEQQRIVEAIEQQFTRLDAATAALERARANIKRYRASVLAAACSGHPTVRLGDRLREPLRNGKSLKRSGTGTVRVLTLTAVTLGDFSERNTKLTDMTPEEATGLWLEPDDILIERSNTPELVGTARRYTGPRDWAVFPDLLIRVRPNSTLLPRFAEIALQAGPLRDYFKTRARGIAGSMPKIDQTIVCSAPVPDLPILNQQRIVADVERRLSFVQNVESTLDASVRRAEALRQSILKRAFEGKLVPQDPNDEPASVLLERIRAERAAAAMVTAKRTPRRKARA